MFRQITSPATRTRFRHDVRAGRVSHYSREAGAPVVWRDSREARIAQRRAYAWAPAWFPVTGTTPSAKRGMRAETHRRLRDWRATVEDYASDWA